MKFVHVSDLHLGKRLHEYSLIEDQKFILDKIVDYAKQHRPDAVLICGDVYDKSIPTQEAVCLFDSFLTQICALDIPCLIISGNHDSQERLSFGSAFMSGGGVHMSPVFSGETKRIEFNDELGKVNFYLLPFIKPASLRPFFDEEIVDYTDAVSVAISRMDIDKSKRNVLLTHQFVTGAKRTASEEVSVGGLDNVDASVFCDFDYVALGHLHSPQHCDRPEIRYSGSILKYSFSEAYDEKSITVVDMLEKGSVKISILPLTPLRDLKIIKGTYNELMSPEFYLEKACKEDYVNAVLTDEEDIIDVVSKLRTVYKNLMHVEYDNARTKKDKEPLFYDIEQELSPYEMFCELYYLQNNKELSGDQSFHLFKVINNLKEEL